MSDATPRQAWMVYQHPEAPGYFTMSPEHVAAVRKIPGTVIVPMTYGEPEVTPPAEPPIFAVGYVQSTESFEAPPSEGGFRFTVAVVRLTRGIPVQKGDMLYIRHPK